MDKTAIALIQETAPVIQAANRLSTDEFSASVALPDNYKIHSLEELQQCRNQYRATFTTKSGQSFSDYVANMLETATVVVSAEKMKAVTVFDAGTTALPGHCKHTAGVQLDRTPAFDALMKCSGERRSQKGMAEFIEDWAEHFDAGYEGEVQGLAAIVRTMDVDHAKKFTSTVQNFSQKQTSIEKLEASSSAGELPGFLEFRCIPYPGLTDRAVKLRFSVVTRSDSVEFLLKVIRPQELAEELGREFIDLLAEKLPDAEVIEGSIQY